MTSFERGFQSRRRQPEEGGESEGHPGYEVVGETAHGPELRRRETTVRAPEDAPDLPTDETGAYVLSEKGRAALRQALLAAGIVLGGEWAAKQQESAVTEAFADGRTQSTASAPEALEQSTSRAPEQPAPLDAATAADVAVGDTPTHDAPVDGSSPSQPPAAVTSDRAPVYGVQLDRSLRPVARPEAIGHNAERGVELAAVESFEAQVNWYESRFSTPYDAIVFLDAAGQPVGEPVPFQFFVGPYPADKTPKPGQAPEYQYSPGASFDETLGFPLDGVSKEWITYVREYELTPAEAAAAVDVVNVIPEFKAIFANPQLEELHALIMRGEVRTYADVVSYFINQPFAGSEGMDRYEFIRSKLRLDALPTAAQDELQRLIPGLMATESAFRDDLTSSTGARGAGQFMPDEWRRVTGESVVDTAFARQIEVMDTTFPDFYFVILDAIGDDAVAELRSQYASEEAFVRELAVRLAIDGFHAGPARTAEVVRTYLEVTPVAERPAGSGLYAAIAAFGEAADDKTYAGKWLDGYGSYSASYVAKVTAAANVLNRTYSGDTQQVASD
ncbi:MAG: lytic transglycosylase domain-containing protein [Patescibacteria group bacterium]